MKDMRLSIAMCSYNGSRFLNDQLQSIRDQMLSPDELVVCDDASSDETTQILERFALSAPFPVRILRNERNLGPARNFEQAIRLCQGDLIALCDQDDYWHPNKLQVLSHRMQDTNIGGAFSDAELMDVDSNPLGIRLSESIKFSLKEQLNWSKGGAASTLLKRNVVTGATFIFRSQFRSIFTPTPDYWMHDGWIAWMLV